MLEEKNTQPKVVMQEHDPNDDPFADLIAVETKQLVSPLEFGTGAVSPTKNAPTNKDAARHEDEEKHVDAARQVNDEEDNGAAHQEDEEGNKAVDDEKAKGE